MWRTGSSFDGEGYRLSDPSLYRVLDEAESGLTDLSIADPPSSQRRRPHNRGPRRDTREKWREERC